MAGPVTITYNVASGTFTVSSLASTPPDTDTTVLLENGTTVILRTVGGPAVTLTAAPGQPLGPGPLVANDSSYPLNAVEPFVLSYGKTAVAITPWMAFSLSQGFAPKDVTAPGGASLTFKDLDGSAATIDTVDARGNPTAMFVEQQGGTSFQLPELAPFTILGTLEDGDYDLLGPGLEAEPIRGKIIISTPKRPKG